MSHTHDLCEVHGCTLGRRCRCIEALARKIPCPGPDGCEGAAALEAADRYAPRCAGCGHDAAEGCGCRIKRKDVEIAEHLSALIRVAGTLVRTGRERDRAFALTIRDEVASIKQLTCDHDRHQTIGHVMMSGTEWRCTNCGAPKEARS